MTRQVTIAVDEGSEAGDELRSLYGWLTGEDELRGLVRLVELPPPVGSLGPVADVLLVLQPPLVALVAALATWIRSRNSAIDVTITDDHGLQRRISAQQVRRLTPAEVANLVAQLTATIGATPPTAAVPDGIAVAEPAPLSTANEP